MRKGTADRVWESLGELGYIPFAASKLVAKNRLLGLLINPVFEVHSADLIARFHENASMLGYEVLTRSIGESSQQAADHLQTFLERKVDGIAALVLNPDSLLSDALSRIDVPVIRCYSNQEIRRGAAFSIDYLRGVREAVQHLALLGHREIAFIASAPGHLATQRKSEAFLVALKEIGCMPKWLIEADPPFTGGIAGMERLIASNPRPTAVLCSCDAVALGALWALWRAGIPVPDGISLICVDHCQFAEWMAPPVTTVQTSVADLAKTAVDALQKIIENPLADTARSVLKVPTSLVVRGSTSYPPGRALPRTNQTMTLLEQPSNLGAP